jgi:hypothetical protein
MPMCSALSSLADAGSVAVALGGERGAGGIEAVAGAATTLARSPPPLTLGAAAFPPLPPPDDFFATGLLGLDPPPPLAFSVFGIRLRSLSVLPCATGARGLLAADAVALATLFVPIAPTSMEAKTSAVRVSHASEELEPEIFGELGAAVLELAAARAERRPDGLVAFSSCEHKYDISA